jgi:hypothetical protein
MIEDIHGGKPMSVCRCGHTGDGPNSQHEKGPLAEGHGKCKECDCKKFSWASFINESEG